MTPPAEIVGLFVLALIAWLIWDSLRAREAAVAASRAACASEQYQFLDDTVAIESVRPVRDDDGVVRLKRVYGFEYSDTGNNRHKGTVLLVGDRVVLLRIGASSATGNC